VHARYVSLHNFAAGTIQAVATWRLENPISSPIRILKLCCAAAVVVAAAGGDGDDNVENGEAQRTTRWDIYKALC